MLWKQEFCFLSSRWALITNEARLTPEKGENLDARAIDVLL
jgi:hypothetical protein